jgi:stage III sporulation protein AE
MREKERRKKIWQIVFAGICLWLLCSAQVVTAKEIEEDIQITDELLDRLDMKEIEDYLKENEETEDISFLDLVTGFIRGNDGANLREAGNYLSKLLFSEFRENRQLLVIIVAMAASFALLKNFSTIFKNSYISDLCFVLVYIELMILLMKSFLIMHELLQSTLGKIVDFMKMLLPVFAMSMVFSNGTNSAAGFYEMTFLVVFLVQWVLLYLLAPLVQIFVVMQFLNYILEGEKFSRMCELLEDGIRWGMKIVVTLVMGLNVVQGLIYPAIDRLKTSSWTKAIGMIPGIGNSANAIGEMLIGTGMVIKNSVGVAAMLVLVILVAVPLVKIFVMSFLYKIASAVLEPITDKRIAGSINGVFKGSVLAGKLMLTSLFLFFVTIAMITAATSYAVG